jgi:hypothetical protein
MNGRSVTASFGVTEIQPGDTPETMLRRADRALLMAKGSGRNTVVQLGSGFIDDDNGEKSGPSPAKQMGTKELCRQVLITPVPLKMAIEKLRGFVADHRAKVLEIEGNKVRLEIDDRERGRLRRWTDRPVTFCLRLAFEEERLCAPNDRQSSGGTLRTRIQVSIGPTKDRDRRRNDVLERARDVLVSFRAYLMATEEELLPAVGTLTRVKQILTFWLAKK